MAKLQCLANSESSAISERGEISSRRDRTSAEGSRDPDRNAGMGPVIEACWHLGQREKVWAI